MLGLLHHTLEGAASGLGLLDLLGRLGQRHEAGRRNHRGVVWPGAARRGEGERVCHFGGWGVKLAADPHPQRQHQANDHTHKSSLQEKPWK